MKIVIEIVTPETVKALQQENADLRRDLGQLRGQYNSLHETLYRFMDQFIELKRSAKRKE